MPIAQMGSYAITTSASRDASTSARSASIWRLSTASVSPASRWSSVSPTQRMGRRPAPSSAGTLRASASSVSQKRARRSEWPTIAPATPSSRSIGIAISPVNAPESASWTFWAAIRTGERRVRSAAAARAVAGGQITSSTPSSSPIAPRKRSRNSSVSATVLCIFQFAATSGVKPGLRRCSGIE